MIEITSAWLLFATSMLGGGGIAAFRFDLKTGVMTQISMLNADGLKSPLFVAVDRSGRFLFVADHAREVDGVAGGALAAYAIDPDTKALRFINRVPVTGTVPCYVSVSPDGRFALTANYGDGSISVIAFDPEKGLGDVVCRVSHDQEAGTERKARAHSVIFDPEGRHVLAADLGVDKIYIYRWHAETGMITPAATPFVATKAGAGPRHLAFHPQGNDLYCMTEYDNTLLTLSWDGQTGRAELLHAYPALPEGFSGKSYGSDVHVDPTGRFVYAANRGHDSIVGYRIHPETRQLTLIGHFPTQGNFPRAFDIDPTGGWLIVANEKSGHVLSFSIHPETGALENPVHHSETFKTSYIGFAGSPIAAP